MHEIDRQAPQSFRIGHFRHQRMEVAATGARWVKGEALSSPLT